VTPGDVEATEPARLCDDGRKERTAESSPSRCLRNGELEPPRVLLDAQPREAVGVAGDPERSLLRGRRVAEIRGGLGGRPVGNPRTRLQMARFEQRVDGGDQPVVGRIEATDQLLRSDAAAYPAAVTVMRVPRLKAARFALPAALVFTVCPPPVSVAFTPTPSSVTVAAAAVA